MKVRLVAYDPYGDRRGVVLPAKLSLTRIVGDLSSGSVSWLESAPTAERMSLPVEVAVEVAHDDSTFVELPDSRLRIGKANHDRVGRLPAQTAQFIGLGVALREATVWDVTPGNENGKREFKSSTAGDILTALLDAAKARKSANGLTWAQGAITWTFTATHDSAGKPWVRSNTDSRATVEFAPTQSIFEVLDWLRRKGLIDWRMQGRELQVYRADDSMRVKRSTTRMRNAFASAMPVAVDYSQLATDARFHGDEGKTFDRAIRDSVRYFGRIERHTQQGQTTTEATANLYLDELENASKLPALQYRREWTDGIKGAPRLGIDYDLSDWVLIDKYGEDKELRVVEQNLDLSEKGAVSGFETLGTRILDLTERLARRTHDLSVGQVGSDSGAPRPPDKDDVVLPAPEGVVVSADAMWVDGQPYGVATVGWSAVPDAARYEVWVTRPDWRSEQLAATVESAPAVIGRLPVGKDISVRVRAVAKKGTPGKFSQPVKVTVPRDNQAPGQPSIPILSQEAGLLHVLWDGKFYSGQEPPADYDHMEVAAAETIRELKDSDIIATIPLHAQSVWARVEHGVRRYIFFRAVDWAGNKGPWSFSEDIIVTSPVQGVLDESKKYVDGQIKELDDKLKASPKITYSANAPTGPAPEGATWFRYNSTGVIGHWRGDGTRWVEQPLTSQVIANLDVGKLTAGNARFSEAVVNKLWAEVITARKIAAEQVEISRDGNLAVTPRPPGARISAWSRLNISGDSVKFDRAGTYAVSVMVEADHQLHDDVKAAIESRFTTGGVPQLVSDTVTIPHGVTMPVELTVNVTAPGSAEYYLRNMSPTIAGTRQDLITKSVLQVRPQMGGALIVNGGITADKINAESIWADTAFLGLAVAKIVKADMFEGREFTGGTFTGPLIQTDAKINRGIKITPNGFYAYDTSGRRSVEIDSATGRAKMMGRYDSGQTGEPGISIVPVHESTSGDAGIFWSYSLPTIPGGTTPGIWMNRPGLGNDSKPLTLRGQLGGGIEIEKKLAVRSGLATQESTVVFERLPATSAAGNTHIDVYGIVHRSSSSRKLKTNITPIDAAKAAKVLDVEPVTFLDRGEVERHKEALAAEANGELDVDRRGNLTPPRTIVGFIAEQVADAGLDELVTRDADGEIDGLMYDRITAYLLPIVKAQRDKIADLETRLAKLETRLTEAD